MDSLSRSLLQDLVAATKVGDVEAMQTLLTRGARSDIVDTDSGWSALHAAVLFLHPGTLELLLRHCDNPDRAMVGGGTALSYAIHELGESPASEKREALLAAVQNLLAAGADPKVGGPDQTALELVRMYRLADIEPLLAGMSRTRRTT
jgi:ankyrin repeat protein